MPRLFRVLVLVAGLPLIATLDAHAQEAMIKYRQAVMSAVGGHTGASAAIVKGEVPFREDLAAHASAIAALAKMAPHIFPEGSGSGETDALPAIWEKPDEFEKRVKDFQTTAAAFADAASDDPKAAAAALGELGKSCKACHDDFRKEK